MTYQGVSVPKRGLFALLYGLFKMTMLKECYVVFIFLALSLVTSTGFLPNHRSKSLSKRQADEDLFTSLLSADLEASFIDRPMNETRLSCYFCSTFKDPQCRNRNLILPTTPESVAVSDNNDPLTDLSSSITTNDPSAPLISLSDPPSTTQAPAILPNVATKECSPQEGFCVVTRVEYMSNERKEKKFWVLERGCTASCMEGCIVLGEGESEVSGFEASSSSLLAHLILLAIHLINSPLISIPASFYHDD